MDYDRQKLEAVENKIEDLLKEKKPLSRKQKTGKISDEEVIDLEGIVELLNELRENKKYWLELVKLSMKGDSAEIESKAFTEADIAWIESVCDVNCQQRYWTTYVLDETIQPSEHFRKLFIDTSRVFHQNCEAGRRIFLNIFLSDIVSSPAFIGTLKIFPEVSMDVTSTHVAANGKWRKLTGRTDYTVGFSRGLNIFQDPPSNELHLVAVEAKRNINDADVDQCIAETATLYKSRKDQNKAKCAVWGILSNAKEWKFIYIDEKGFLWRTHKFKLQLDKYEEDQVLFIYRMIYYMVKGCSESSPPVSPNVSANEL